MIRPLFLSIITFCLAFSLCHCPSSFLVDKTEKESTMRTTLIILLYFVKEFKERAAFSQVEPVAPVACLEILSDSSVCLPPPGCGF